MNHHDAGRPGLRPMDWPPQTFLGMLAGDAREELLALGRSRQYLANETLMGEGDPTNFVVVLVDGWVKIVSSTEEGGKALLSLRIGGALIGEQAALDNRPRSATVISAGVTTAQVLSQQDFLAFLYHRADAAVAVCRSLSNELRWATRRRIDFSGLPVKTRLARVLSELGRLYGQPTANGIVLQYELTQPEFAAMVGASEPSVQKALRDLRHDGVVETGYRHVVITNPGALDLVPAARQSNRKTVN
jgi:CRP/FNR family transcriptional regulator, cyclic AMP receptor protein